ncbi:phosphatidylinositol-bisphosphatase [Clonorchis sinensis]|uniref:Phosphatidylinositol-bisphosphatase n=1 Tax=Clonorchis sinensis TaxID=79923 RepID=G7YCS8_CLOSI|nr:phosphatidylinositol-bisphosphatase [Clonorchis sinensis]
MDVQELLSMAQNYLNSRTVRGHESADKCELALKVQRIQDWVKSPRVAAIVTHVESEQSVLFFFTESRSAKGSLVQLTPEELIGLNYAFQCEPMQSDQSAGPAVRLRIRGHRLTKTSMKRNSMSQVKVVRATGDGSLCGSNAQTDSDEPSEPVGIMYVTKVPQTEEVMRRVRKPKIWSCVLEFANAEEGVRFRQRTIYHAHQGAAGNRNASVNHPDFANFEIGQDVLKDVQAEQTNWLDKYRNEISRQKRDHVIPKSHLPSDGGPINGGPHTSPSTDSDSDVGKTTSTSSSSSETHSSPGPVADASFSSVDNITQTLSGHPSPTPTRPPPPIPSIRHYLSSSSLEPKESLPIPVDAKLQSSNSNNRVDECLQPGTDSHVDQSLPYDSAKPQSLTASQSCSDILSGGTAPAVKETRRKSKNFLEDRLFRTRLSHAELLVRQKLLDRVDEYSTIESVNIFIGTWNVNGRQDSNVSLDDWLLPLNDQPPADIYVFGFQELDLSLGSVALNKTSPAALEDRWTKQLESALGGLLQTPSTKSTSRSWLRSQDSSKHFPSRWAKHTGGGYYRLRRVRLAGILLIVYISVKLFRHSNPSEMVTQLVPTGVFNMMGNKGGVGLRLTIFNTALCFVNCHLAAGEANLERRNQDFQEIKRKMVFGRQSDAENPNRIDQLTIHDHDIVFVFGDLNYRISGLDSTTVRNLVDRKDYDHILGYDELIKQCVSNRAFGSFREGPIAFAPTYKFDTNTNTYDSSEKNRIPSYCDRILWSGKLSELLCYRSHSSFTMSDHKPVSSYFKVGLRRVNRNLFQNIYEAVIRSQDLVYNLSLPQAQLESQDLDFGPVRFYEVSQRTVKLTNTGLTGLQYVFLREGITEFPSWLAVSPETMRVEKGGSVQISIEIFVKPEIVADLNSGKTALSAIVVLRLLGGKDYFISVSGQFIPTCFGLPLSLLLSLDSLPVAFMPISELQDKIRSARVGDWQEAEPSVLARTDKPPFHVPKEIFRLVDYISQHLEEPELFRQTGQYGEVGVIRDLLDTTLSNIAFPETISVHAAAFCLLIFLNTMPEPVIPPAFHATCLDACGNLASAVKSLSRLPIDYQNLFCYLTAFLRRCLALSDKNGTDVQLLASAFGDVIFRDAVVNPVPSGRKNTRTTALVSRQESPVLFIRQFLMNDAFSYFSRLP